MRRPPTLRLLLVLSMLAALLPASSALALDLLSAADADADAIEPTHSDSLTHVKNLEYPGRYGAAKNQGTDLEFTELDVTGLPGAVERGVTGVRQFSVAGSYNNGLQIVDITDPENAEIVGVYDCAISQGDPQVFKRDGRTYAVYTWDTGYSGNSKSACIAEAKELGFRRPTEGSFIADITDPYNPKTVSYVQVPLGSHNGTVHPSGDYFYNSNSELITNAANAAIEVYDIRDFAEPKLVKTLPISPRPGLGTDSHDITFNADGSRAYSAALSQGLIINTEDPANPTILTSWVDPAINVWHQADPITITDPVLGERTFVVVEDEVAGATPTAQCPNGGVHVYDITGELELAPVKVGYWNIAEARAFSTGLGCTAHVFDLHEDEALMTIAYYQGGVRVVDLAGLVGVALGNQGVGMKEIGYLYFGDEGGLQGGVDEGASDTWAFKAPFVDKDGVFYAYGNDQNRGFDVYKFDGTGGAETASENGGEWLTPLQAAARAAAAPKVDLSQRENRPYCLLKA